MVTRCEACQATHDNDPERAALLRRIATATPPKDTDYEVVWSGGAGLTSYPDTDCQ